MTETSDYAIMISTASTFCPKLLDAPHGNDFEPILEQLILLFQCLSPMSAEFVNLAARCDVAS